MKPLTFEDFKKKHNMKDNIKNESYIQSNYNYPINPRDSKIYSDKGCLIMDNGSQSLTHWTCFIVKNNKSYYFDSFGGQADKFILNQLPKPITYHE